MQSVAIFLRRTWATNKFREVILNTLRLDQVDSALICSGFFQEGPKYSAGTDLSIIPYRTRVPIKVTTLGLYSYSWNQQYTSFFANLTATNSCSCTPPCFSAVQKRIPGMGWHAKVFLAKHGPDPVVGIIGSSNITRRAFGAFKDFNYECDVVFWDETNLLVAQAVEAAIGDFGENSDVIVTTYDQQHRANRRPLRDRLLDLENEILDKAVDV